MQLYSSYFHNDNELWKDNVAESLSHTERVPGVLIMTKEDAESNWEAEDDEDAKNSPETAGATAGDPQVSEG